MNYLIAGAFSGLIMASAFTSIGTIMLFLLSKNPPYLLRTGFQKTRPIVLTMGFVFLSYPIWSILGVGIGFLLKISMPQTTGIDEGNTNLAFTIFIVALGSLMSILATLLMKKIWAGIVTLTIAFIFIFGWILPHLAN